MANAQTSATKAQAVRDYAAQTTGSDTVTVHWTRALRFTQGAQFLADTCGAWWLIDAIASHQPEIRPADRGFQVWRLAPQGDEWLLDAWTDTPGYAGSKRLAAQAIPYSDFPRELCEPKGFELWVESGVLMLKEER